MQDVPIPEGGAVMHRSLALALGATVGSTFYVDVQVRCGGAACVRVRGAKLCMSCVFARVAGARCGAPDSAIPAVRLRSSGLGRHGLGLRRLLVQGAWVLLREHEDTCCCAS